MMIKPNLLILLATLLWSLAPRSIHSERLAETGNHQSHPGVASYDDSSSTNRRLQLTVCPGDIRECPDGSTVVRVPPDCEFEQCDGGVCPSDIKECPDGSTVVRQPPDCEFEDCPEDGGCPLDVFECPDGSFVGREPPDCEFADCESACPLDVFECPDGSTVTRVPPDCEFGPCPTESPTANPTENPSPSPTPAPTEAPTSAPSVSPTEEGTDEPSRAPSRDPSSSPSFPPSNKPSTEPSVSPSGKPSSSPSDAPSGQPSVSPSQEPTEVGASAEPSTSPSQFPSTSPSISMAPSMMPTNKPINCSEYQYEIEVPGLEGVTLQYVVNLHFNDTLWNNITNGTADWWPGDNITDWLPDNITDWSPTENSTDWWNNNNNNNNNTNQSSSSSLVTAATISVRVVYEGQGWLAFGVSPTGMMLGSDAVIGVPSSMPGMTTVTSTNVRKNHLTFEDGAPGYVLLGEEHQRTLMDATITQNQDQTILKFTKFLQEDGEVPIDGNGLNYFLIAHGTDTNELGYHGTNGRSSFNLTLSPCIELGEVGEAFVDFIGGGDLTGVNLPEVAEEEESDEAQVPREDPAAEQTTAAGPEEGVGPTVLESSGAGSIMPGKRQHQGVIIALVIVTVSILNL